MEAQIKGQVGVPAMQGRDAASVMSRVSARDCRLRRRRISLGNRRFLAHGRILALS